MDASGGAPDAWMTIRCGADSIGDDSGSPGHSAAAFHVAFSLAAARAADLPWMPRAPPHRRAIRRRLLVDGYGRVVADWARVLAEAEYLDRRNTRRLLQLIEMADAFDAEASLRPASSSSMCARPASKTATSQVRVMTIHRSKGLEFDAVFLPGCTSGSLVRRHWW